MLHILPSFSTNYIYIVEVSPLGVIVIDPGQSAGVIQWLKQRGKHIEAILCTHGDYDHRGGIEDLYAWEACTVYIPKISGEEGNKIVLQGDQTIEIAGLEICVLDVPGHTVPHLAYYIESRRELFSGDCLFTMGCGRMREGTPVQFWNSLKKLRNLPGMTRVYSGHEYAVENCDFALSLGYLREEIAQKRCFFQKQLQFKKPNVGSLLEEEKKYNPFLLCDSFLLRKVLGLKEICDEDLFREIRQRKDVFVPIHQKEE